MQINKRTNNEIVRYEIVFIHVIPENGQNCIEMIGIDVAY